MEAKSLAIACTVCGKEPEGIPVKVLEGFDRNTDAGLYIADLSRGVGISGH